MLQCPNCQREVKPEERFCGNCGARLTPQTPPPDAAQPPTPPRSIGKETVVLPAVDPDATRPEPANRPNPDATIVAGPASAPPSSGGSYSVPPILPTTPATPPPSLPPAGGMYPNASLPSGSNMPPQGQKSGGNVWKILAIIAGIGLLACIALAVGGFLLFRRVSSVPGNLVGTATGGGVSTTIAALETAVADPTFQAISELPTSAAEPTAAASGGGSVLYKQTFDNASSDFNEDETANATYKFVDGAYSVSAKKPNLIVWQKIKGDYGNTAISLDTTIDGPEESAAGLLFHYQDDKNFYLFTITGDGRYGLDVYKDDNLTTLIDWTESSAINKVGDLNSLRVETIDDTIRLYANDTLLDEISDSTFKRGKTAIAINTFDDPKLTVTFDNLVIRAIK
jgi:zinc-ribbon domain